MKLTGETKLYIGIIVVTIALIGGAIALFSRQAEVPTRSREELIPDGTFTRGNASASAYLVEFSDFQCAACKAFEPFVDAIIQQHSDKLLYAYRYFPLTQHPYSMKAAIAAEAANRQGKFWEFHEALFKDQDTLSDETVQKIAQDMKLDIDVFNKDLKGPAVQAKIEKDQKGGETFGINATPTFFLNGKALSISTPQDLQQAVADAVK
jgi:protein-disulfide isomerase